MVSTFEIVALLVPLNSVRLSAPAPRSTVAAVTAAPKRDGIVAGCRR